MLPIMHSPIQTTAFCTLSIACRQCYLFPTGEIYLLCLIDYYFTIKEKSHTFGWTLIVSFSSLTSHFPFECLAKEPHKWTGNESHSDTQEQVTLLISNSASKIAGTPQLLPPWACNSAGSMMSPKMWSRARKTVPGVWMNRPNKRLVCCQIPVRQQ